MRVNPPVKGKGDNTSGLETYFTRQDVLNYFGIKERTYRRWRAKGYLRGIQKGWSYLYTKEEITNLVKRLEKEFQR